MYTVLLKNYVFLRLHTTQTLPCVVWFCIYLKREQSTTWVQNILHKGVLLSVTMEKHSSVYKLYIQNCGTWCYIICQLIFSTFDPCLGDILEKWYALSMVSSGDSVCSDAELYHSASNIYTQIRVNHSTAYQRGLNHSQIKRWHDCSSVMSLRISVTDSASLVMKWNQMDKMIRR